MKHFVRIRFKSGLIACHMGKTWFEHGCLCIKGRRLTWRYPLENIVIVETEIVRWTEKMRKV